MRAGAQHDRIAIARQHAGGIGDGLAAAKLHVLRIEHDRGATELVHGDLEGDAGSGRRPLEDHSEHRPLAQGLRPLRLLALAFNSDRVVEDRAQGLCVQCVDVEKMLWRHGKRRLVGGYAGAETLASAAQAASSFAAASSISASPMMSGGRRRTTLSPAWTVSIFSARKASSNFWFGTLHFSPSMRPCPRTSSM